MAAMRADLAEQIAENGIAMHEVGHAYQMTRVVYAPGHLIGQERAVDQVGRRPVGVDQPGKGRYIPDHAGRPEGVGPVLAEYLTEVIADAAGAADTGL